MSVFRIKNKYKQNGYTLIELLLVVTVIAVIAALAVKTYRDKSESDRINIAALNIQHVLESGMSYDVAKGYWPKQNWGVPCPTGSGIQDQDFVKYYLPNESNQGNFGTPLCWSGDDPNTPTVPQKAPRFWVAMQVPGANPSNTALRIAARLPNAIITSTPTVEPSTPTNTCATGSLCYVKAAVSVPSATPIPQKSYVSAVGQCDPSKGQVGETGSVADAICKKTNLSTQFPGITKYQNDDSLSEYEIDFTCKTNEVGSVYVTPSFLKTDRDTKYTTSSPFYDLTVSSVNCQVQGNAQQCFVTFGAATGAEAGTPADAVGCQQKYIDAGLNICTCYSTTNTHTCGNEPGAIGGSYIAVCSAKTSQNLADDSSHKIW